MDSDEIRAEIMRAYADSDMSKRAVYLRQASTFAEKFGPFVRSRVCSESWVDYIEAVREDGSVLKCALIQVNVGPL